MESFIHFKLRMEIERLYLEWCEHNGIANLPNSFVAFMMGKGWLNDEKIVSDLEERKDEPQTCEDAISIEVAIQTTWMILNGMGYPKELNKELDQTIKAVFDTAPRVLPNHSGEAAGMVEDAISREAAIKSVLRLTMINDCVSINAVLYELNNLPSVAPSRPSGEWIPCSERLPTKEEQDDELGVLVTLGNGYSGLQFDYYYNGLWDDWNGYVVAWMPLPEPYKKANHQEEEPQTDCSWK